MIIQVLQKRYALFYLFILLLSGCFTSCVFEQYNEVISGEEPVIVTFSTRSFQQDGISFSKFRLIAFSTSGSLEVNETMDKLQTSGNRFSLNIRPGAYTIMGIGNERADMTTALTSVVTQAEADRITMRSIENMDSTKLPVIWKQTVFIRENSPGSKIGQISYNNKDWLNVLEMSMERMASKIEVFIRKESNVDIASAVRFVPRNIPLHSYLTSQAYEGLFSDTSVEINTEVTDAFVRIFDRIYPEHLASAPNRNTSAELEVNVNGTKNIVALPIGNLERNKIYRFEVLVTAKNIEVGNLIVSPWEEVVVNENTDGVEINFSRVEVPYSFDQESVVHFTTKSIPESSLKLLDDVYFEDGTKAGYLTDLFDRVTSCVYSYDPVTHSGRGKLIIKRKKASQSKHRINIYASGLRRSILVDGLGGGSSNIYRDDTPKQLALSKRQEKGNLEKGSYSVRCRIDDTPDVIIPQYKISYDAGNGGFTPGVKGSIINMQMAVEELNYQMQSLLHLTEESITVGS